MPKAKINLFLLVALFFTAMTWLLKAYEGYADGEIRLGIIFTFLFGFIFTLFILGLIHNKKFKKNGDGTDE